MSATPPGAGRMTIGEALQKALAAWAANDLPTVERLCRAILQANPGAFDALHLLGLLAMRLGRSADAAELFARAAAAQPASVEARYNLGLARHAQGRHEEALAAFGEVIARRPAFAEAYNDRGVAWRALGRNAEALADYDAALRLDPASAPAHNNRGVVLRDLRRPVEALESYERALAAAPGFAEAHFNRGSVLADLGRHAEALASQERAIAAAPGFAQAWVRRGVALTDLGDHGGAVESFRRARELAPGLDWLDGVWMHAKMRICDWEGLDAELARMAQRIERGERAAQPFPCLALYDSPALHARAARTWTEAHVGMPPLQPLPRLAAPGTTHPAGPRRRIHVAYFSADFHEHATSHLLAGALERHDRDAFEVTAFSFGPKTGDAMQARIAAAVERFVDVRELTDEAVVRMARELRVDVAVDLKGYTDHARTAIFALRAAAVQVNYLGYPGTMAAPFIDAVIADRTVVPEHARGDFTERVVYVDGCYQVNDAGRAMAAPAPREAHGLPAQGFVFCCFNNPYKILPATFASWMRVLTAVPGSVLWLLADHPRAMANLREEARRRGVDPARLAFAERRPPAEYMARFACADAFLDTFPYNAHTTASDALWVGVPVVTRPGVSFPSRVAASLLGALQLDALVAQTPAQYEALAIRLATDVAWRESLRERLARARTTSALFDPAKHARGLEAVYRALVAC